MAYLLAYDVGTGGTKAALITPDGQVAGKAFEPYPTHYPRRLWAEQDPEDWWRAVGQTTQRVLQAAPARPGDILGLAFSTQMVNLIAVDRQAQPLARCISWLDGRAVEEAQLVMRKLGGPAIFAMLIGVALTGKDLLPKYLWLKRNSPDLYTRAAALVDASGYLLHQATGQLVYEWTSACVTGLFNMKSKAWDNSLMRLFRLDPDKFPPLVQSCERVGGLTRQAATHLGLAEGTPVFAGAGDAMAAAVGSGAVGEGEGHLCLGTSGFVGIVTSRRVTGRRGLVTLQSADRHKFLLLGEMETCGECLKWAARALYGSAPQPSTFAQMDADVAATAPGAGGLLFTPWMYGERSPVADEQVRAAFVNLGANHSREQLTRAIYEGTAFNLRWILDSMAELYGFRPGTLRVIGGGARGQPWVRIVADVTGRTLEIVPNPQDAGAVGAALIAAVGLEIYPSLEATKAVIPAGSAVAPDTAPQATYNDLYFAFKSLYPSLRPLYHRLNRPIETPEA
ncbi:MAG: FGGY-family carbohydrate kinase [Chloroflexota bacterium]